MTGIRVDARSVRRQLDRASRAVEPRVLLRAIGERHRQWVDDNFRGEGIEEKWQPLSPNTVAARRKGSNKILQDTGQLKQNWTVVVRGDSVEVGTNQEQAPWHHQGTRPFTILPRRPGGLLRFTTAGGTVFARSVSHPGLPRRPLLPSRSLGTELAVDAAEAIITESVR